MSVIYTATLSVREQTVLFVSTLLHSERQRRGTRTGTRALSCFKQAILVIRWFCDGTRMSQLARDNAIGKSTGYDYLHEGIDVLSAQAPSLHGALLAAKAAGYSHVNLDGTLTETDRVATPGATPGVDCGGRPSTITMAATSRSSPLPTAGRSGPPTYGRAVSMTPPPFGPTPRSCPRSPISPTTCAGSATSATKARPTPAPSRSGNPRTASSPASSRCSTRPTTGYVRSVNAATPS